MSYIGDFALGSTFDTKFCTVSTTGAPTTLAGTPVISAYVDNSLTQITAGITLSVDFDGVTGLHNVRVVATSGNGYATASNYQLVITTGTVGGTSVVGYVVAEFSIEARSALRPTTAARTLDVSATGEAGVDWANVGSPTTVVGLTGTTVKTATDVETDTADIQTRLPAALVGARMDSNASAISGVAATADRLEAWMNSFITGAAVGVPTATVIGTDLTEATDDHFNHMIMVFTGGVLLGQARRISDYNGTTKEITVQPAFTEAPAAADTFIIVTIIVGGLDANGRMDLGSVLGSAMNALIAGRIDANAQVVGTGAIVAGSFGAGARDAASQSADAVAEIADAVYDEARSGHTTQGTYGEAHAMVISGSAIAGTLSTTQMTTDLTEATDDHFNGRTLIWTSGVLLAQATKITDYTGLTKLCTYTAVTEAPSAGDKFIIV